MGRIPQILALGGGGFSMEAGNPLVDDFALEITGSDRPRVCFVPTASGDADHYVVRFYRRFSPVAECSHLSLFRRDKGAGAVEGDIERHLLAQDLIYVGGGSVLSLLGTWRAHGVDAMLRRAWRRGAPPSSWPPGSRFTRGRSPTRGSVPVRTDWRSPSKRSVRCSSCWAWRPSGSSGSPPASS